MAYLLALTRLLVAMLFFMQSFSFLSSWFQIWPDFP